MNGFFGNLEDLALANEHFRQVLYTGTHSQLVVMSLRPGEDIGEEVHDVDQFFRVESGEGKAVLNGTEHELEDGSSLVVPAGATHNIINTSEEESLKLYTIYSPPEHKDGTVHTTKVVAEADDEHFDGQTSE
jgi:mannose-6-phosphate isomerase-like protein (cupin superfamily)